MQKQYVRNLFDSIAHRYDLLNHLLSGGVDFYWRRRAVEHLRDIRPIKILDVATGTADFAIASLHLQPETVIGVDIAEEMLERARKKLKKRGLDSLVTLQTADAEDLPFESGDQKKGSEQGFDATIVAFGVRNFEHLEQGLSEMYRVLRPGGRIVVLEFSRPHQFPFKQLYFLYFHNVLPVVGRAISKHLFAYKYLRDTVVNFPEGEEFIKVLHNVGFETIVQDRVTFGIVTIYVGVKPKTNVR